MMPQPVYPKPKPRVRWWVYAIVGVFVVVLCAFGGIALLGAGGKAIVDGQHQEEAQRSADIKITSCKLGDFGMGEIAYTIVNSGDSKQDYVPHFNFTGKNGEVFGEASDIVSGLAAGKTYHGKAVGSYTDGATRCVLIGA